MPPVLGQRKANGCNSRYCRVCMSSRGVQIPSVMSARVEMCCFFLLWVSYYGWTRGSQGYGKDRSLSLSRVSFFIHGTHSLLLQQVLPSRCRAPKPPSPQAFNCQLTGTRMSRDPRCQILCTANRQNKVTCEGLGRGSARACQNRQGPSKKGQVFSLWQFSLCQTGGVFPSQHGALSTGSGRWKLGPRREQC